MAILKRSPKPVSALTRIGIIPNHINPAFQYAANERPALELTQSGFFEVVTGDGIVESQRDVKKDCGCGGKKANNAS
jgi:hypothetical protein